LIASFPYIHVHIHINSLVNHAYKS
jgi:hypothetical protein